MKEKLLASFAAALLAAAVLLAGCSAKEYTVTFSAGDTSYPAQSVRSGQTIEAPDAPVRDGWQFIGWFQDEGLTKPWDPETDKVDSDLTLWAGWDRDTGDEMSESGNDRDFSDLKTPGSQEEAYAYRAAFLPEKDGTSQPYVGDTMPYYEDGVFYVYYLKEGGDSYNHSLYLATTEDFVTWEEHPDPVIEADRSGAQDSWIGTGSVVKAGDTYYFFYTGHTDSAAAEYKEKIMAAKGTSLTSFEKIEGWEIAPPDELGQKNDFRDPQAYYDPETDTISMTVTASMDGTARILKFTLSSDLQSVTYDGVIFTDPVGGFWNLECSDTFKMGDTWYLTYSAQDDTLWYASSDSPWGPYGEPARLDGKLFYAAKHVEDENGTYMAGWTRRSESPSSTQDVSAWGGNLSVQKVVQREDGTLFLAPADSIAGQYTLRRTIPAGDTHLFLDAGSLYSYTDAFTCYESFMITGDFRYSGEGTFGLSFDYSGSPEKNKFIALSPADQTVSLLFNEGSTLITETAAPLEAGKDFSFTYIQEGSAGTFYLDGEAALTVRIYGASGKTIQLFAENNSVLFTSLRQYTPGQP